MITIASSIPGAGGVVFVVTRVGIFRGLVVVLINVSITYLSR